MNNARKILIVEDNDFVRMQLATFLKTDGYEVEEACNGEEGLIKISADIDLAVVDVQMQPMNGLEFVHYLKSFDINIPVILVTGDQHPQLLNNSSKLGVSALLKKPVQKERLIKTIDRIIERHDTINGKAL